MNKNYKYIMVAPACYLGEDKPEDFERVFLKIDTRIRFLEEVVTIPDKDENGNNIEGTGGRRDILFAVHKDDVNDFMPLRFALTVYPWNDWIKYNRHSKEYSKEILERYTVD